MNCTQPTAYRPQPGARKARPQAGFDGEPTNRPSALQPSSHGKTRTDAPRNTAWFSQLFSAYSEWLLKRNFHSVRVLGEPNMEQFKGRPLVIYANHPSWWDPIVGMVIWRRLLRERTSYTPIDAEMLKKYAFFKKLGYFGVDKNSIGGVRTFLKTGIDLLSDSNNLLFITPQGRFADVRETNPSFESGLSHLAAKSRDAVYVPMAIEFTYWEEKRPEVLIRFGECLQPSATQDTKDLNKLLEKNLSDALERLAAASINREVGAFQNLLAGNDGTNPVYDTWRWLKALTKGQTFNAAHGTK